MLVARGDRLGVCRYFTALFGERIKTLDQGIDLLPWHYIFDDIPCSGWLRFVQLDRAFFWHCMFVYLHDFVLQVSNVPMYNTSPAVRKIMIWNTVHYEERGTRTFFWWASTPCAFFFQVFFPSHLLSSPFFSFSLRGVTNSDLGSYSRFFSLLPTTVRALHFCRENVSALSSLVDSCRIVPTHGRRSQHSFSHLFFLHVN